MQIVYVGEKDPETITKSVFLAGPTPRSNAVQSWRPEALRLLGEMNFDGVAFIPERRDGIYHGDYSDQVEWEEKHMNMADCILFWIPRNSDTMLGLTTNNEWGRLEQSGRVVLGTPPGAYHVQYQNYYAKKFFVPVADTLQKTIEYALSLVGKGAPRTGGERDVPFVVWKTAMFQQWYASQKAVGNRLDGASVKWLHRTGPDKSFIFLWILHVNVHVASENRNKVNEFVIARPDIAITIMYRRHPDILDSEVILVREFRSPVSNDTGFVWEAPGGSSFKGTTDPRILAAEECNEETGIVVDPSRIIQHEARQLVATFSAHRAHIFSLELTEAEVTVARQDKGKPHGLIEDSEMTFTEVVTLREMLQETYADWSTVGMIMSVLTKK